MKRGECMSERKQLDRSQDTPLYQQIMDDIRNTIDSGAFSFDKPICTENSLEETYGISRITARRALSELEREGILYRKRGMGSFVSRDIYQKRNTPVAVNTLPAVDSPFSGKVFAFVLPFSISKTGLTTAFQAASDYLNAKGCFTAIYISDETDRNRGRSILHRLHGMGVAGVAYYPFSSNIHLELLDDLMLSGISVCLMDVPSNHRHVASVSSDNFYGSRKLIDHLVSLGHKRIAYLSGVAPDSRRTVSDRYSGYMLGLAEAGIQPDKDLLALNLDEARRSLPADNPNSLSTTVRTLVEHGATAIMTEHDQLAYETILACRNLCLQVPEDISVCGFDNSEWATALMNTDMHLRITTIEQNQAEIGYKVAEILYENLQHPLSSHEPVIISTSFVEGNTTGPAPKK